MANEHVNSISLKALVDKGNNRVIFAELDEAFIDVLFSFLTMPMGAIIRLTRNQPPAVDIGCLNNLYESVENFDVQHLQSEASKTMLLHPRSEVETHCTNLKLKIDDTEPTRYFLCTSSECTRSENVFLSFREGALCACGRRMNREKHLSTVNPGKKVSAIRYGGVFVKGLTRLLMSDDLQVMPLSTAACFSLLSKLGVVDGSTIEEMTFDVGVNEVLNLLKCSLVSKTPLTETLLKQKPVLKLSKKDSNQGSSIIQSQLGPNVSNGDGKISVKIMVSKSRNMVCYAEAGEDFVDLLFSFLTLPLGYIVKKTQGSSSSKGCIDELYSSVHDLDTEHYMKSNEHKAMLISPKVAPGFCYENQPLDIEEASYPRYYYAHNPYGSSADGLTTYETTHYSGKPATVLTVTDPKSHRENTNGGGYVDGPAMFTVTDNLLILPISPLSGISVLKKLKVSFDDVEERILRVGNEEAVRLLVASFVSDSALTNAFIRREPMQER